MPYQIVRFYQDPAKLTEIVGVVQTLEKAQGHCNDPQTSSQTATDPEALERTREFGEWFDGYREV